MVEVDTVESADPALRGSMTSTSTLSDVEDGTESVAVHSDVPTGVSLVDNETGWSMALAKLAALVVTWPASGLHRRLVACSHTCTNVD